ncbi:hypothetical protein EG329_011908 [Mollisiaceae sp. DMI_Dod_QoI]|nr:hypothetical protein EG329_011908 [Helotiales sp. DMI_Dod_QoI]
MAKIMTIVSDEGSPIDDRYLWRRRKMETVVEHFVCTITKLSEALRVIDLEWHQLRMYKYDDSKEGIRYHATDPNRLRSMEQRLKCDEMLFAVEGVYVNCLQAFRKLEGFGRLL